MKQMCLFLKLQREARRMAYAVPSNPEFAIRSGDGQIEFLASPEPIEVVQN